MSAPYPDDAAAFFDDVPSGALPDADHPERHIPGLGTVPASQIQVINWITLPADRATEEWTRLDEFVDQIRDSYGLAPTIVPPLWHRHWELVWELSALHTFWEFAYGPGAAASQPLMFHRYFSEARGRLREWVATCGSKLDVDRATRRTMWPGESAPPTAPECQITDRRADFAGWVANDVARRREQSTARLGELFLRTESGAA